MNTIFTNYNKSNDKLSFTIENADVSLVNAIRRLILTDVTTIGFNTDDYEKSDLKVLSNTGCLHNEFLLHRMGLIPIYSENIDKYDETLYKFILKVQNDTDTIIDVTTRDIVVMNIKTNVQEDTNKFFKQNEITGDHILITKLKQNPDKNGEEIHIEGKSSKGIGSSHIRFSPVSKICFINKNDPKRVQDALTNYLQQNKDKDSEQKLTRRFHIEEADRYYFIDSNGDPNIFDFVIESKGVLKPYKILLEGINSLINILNNFNTNFDKFLKRQDSSINILESDGLMKSYDLTIENENHTLGFILQSYINKLYERDNIFIGYMNPHPLEDKIKFRIKSTNNTITDIHNIFNETSNLLIKLLSELKKNILKEFEGTITFKPKKVSKSKSKIPVSSD
jgi:DNA-directed RNA polymerase subunit L